MVIENRQLDVADLSELQDERWLEITTRLSCRVGCSYCPQTTFVSAYRKGGHPATELSLDTFRECLGRVPRDVAIVFAGFAEPWLNKGCTEMVRHAVRRGHEVRAYTTCVGMTDSDAAALGQLPLARLYVHLPSNAPSGMHLDVDDEYLGILDQLTHQLAESVAFIYHQGSGPHPLVRQLLERHGRDAVQWAVHSRAGHLQTPPPRSLVGGAVRCGQGREQKNVLLPDGSVALCCMDWGLEHVLGNLLDQEYDELFTSAPYLELKAGLSDGTGGRLCRVCEWVESCEAPPHP